MFDVPTQSDAKQQLMEVVARVSPLQSKEKSEQLVQKLYNEGFTSLQQFVDISEDNLVSMIMSKVKEEGSCFQLADTANIQYIRKEAMKILGYKTDPKPSHGPLPSGSEGGGSQKAPARYSNRSRSRDREQPRRRRSPPRHSPPPRSRGHGRRHSPPKRGPPQHHRKGTGNGGQGGPAKPKPDLWRAVEEGDTVAVEQLLEAGKDPEECHQGWTPLMKAAEEDNDEICRILLQRDVQVEAENRKGRTALSFAAAPSFNFVAEHDRPTALKSLRVLLEAGADVHHKDKTGRNARDYATKSRRDDAIALFDEFDRKMNTAG